MPRSEEIRTKLQAAFQPNQLDVIDESERHRHHAGYQEGGESHFRVTMRAEALAPLSRIARHRAVHDALGKQLMADIHALALDLSA